MLTRQRDSIRFFLLLRDGIRPKKAKYFMYWDTYRTNLARKDKRLP